MKCRNWGGWNKRYENQKYGLSDHAIKCTVFQTIHFTFVTFILATPISTFDLHSDRLGFFNLFFHTVLYLLFSLARKFGVFRLRFYFRRLLIMCNVFGAFQLSQSDSSNDLPLLIYVSVFFVQCRICISLGP